MKLLDIFKSEIPVFIEIRGRESVLAQGYCKIEGYLPGRIMLSDGETTVAVTGEGLTLRHLSEGLIAIDGRIGGIEFI